LLVYKCCCEMCRSANIQLLNDLHSLVEKCKLFLLNLFENRDTALGVNKFHAVHLIEELYNSVLLFQLLETHHRFFPVVVMDLKLFFV
jgi:hypothetical protein